MSCDTMHSRTPRPGWHQCCFSTRRDREWRSMRVK
jgi:hypothetical protein